MEEKQIANVKKLLDESTEIHYNIIQLLKQMNEIAHPVAKQTQIPKWMFYKMKDYQYCKGSAWIDEVTPLILEHDVKPKDKISPIFIRLLNLIQLCRYFNNLDLIKEYVEALEAYGIKLTIEAKNDTAPAFSPEAIKAAQNAIDQMKELQKDIYAQEEIFREEKCFEAESYEYVPKNEFREVVDIKYRKKVNKKQKNDKIKKRFKCFHQVEGAINDILQNKM